MRSPVTSRLARGLLPTLAAAMAAVSLAAPGAAAAPTPPAAPGAGPTPPPKPVTAAGAHTLDPSRASASARARATGRAVAVPALTDEYSTTTANPDGSFTLHTYVTPQQVRKAGAWTAVDATLVANADGTYSPRASLNPVTLSGGAAGTPLLALGNGPAHLAYTWPGKLPAPRVSGDTATYRDVYPGVDLLVTVDVNGGAEDTLVIDNAAAAANPALRHIRLGVRASGLTLRRDTAGTTLGVRADGKVAFASGDARMWDSSYAASPLGAPTAPSTAVGPGRGARVARVGQTITATAADITPDAAMLANPALRFPVYVDPAIVSSPSTAQHFNQLTQADPGTTATFDRAQPSGEGVGYQGDYYGGSIGGGSYASGDQCPCGIDRSDFQIGIPSGLYGATIQHAYLQAGARFESDQYTHSATLSMYSVCPLVSGQRWNVPPCVDSSMNPFYPNPVDTFDLHTPERTPPTNYPGQSIQIGNTNSGDWHVASAMQQVVNARKTSWAIEIRGDESNAYNFIRIDQTAISFSIQYDFPPDPPSSLTSTPLPHNGDNSAPASCVNNGWLGANDGASLTTHDTVSTRTGGGTTLQNSVTLTDTTTGVAAPPQVSTWVANPSPVSAQFGGLVDGHRYTWKPTVTSSSLNGYAGQSTAGATCAFTTDFDRPANVVVNSADFPANGTGTARLTAGQAGTFTLSATDPAPSGGTASGIWCYGYALDNDVSVPANGATCTASTGTNSGVVMAGANGTAQVTLTPAIVGAHSVTLYAIDRAGNTAGQSTPYTFYAPANPKASPSPGDVTGDGVPDMLLADPSGNLRVYQIGIDPSAGGSIAAAKADAPPSSTGWNDPNLTFTARGSMHGLFVDDLLVHVRNDPTLYIYRNDNAGHFLASGRGPLTLPSCPTCGNGYPTDGTWTNLVSIAALGDSDKGAVGAYTGSGIGSDPEDFVAVMTDGTKRHLWRFQQSTANAVNPPIIVSNPATDTSSSWATPLFSPGDATGDGLPDTWTRDASGNLVEYVSAKNADGTVDWTGIGGGHGTRTIDTGLPASTYPVLSSSGDITGDATPQPDLWGTSTANGGDLRVWPGTSQSSGSAPFFSAPEILSSNSTYITATPLSPPVLTWLFGNARYTDGSTDLVTVGGVATSDKDTSGGNNTGTLATGVTATHGHDGSDAHFNGTSGVVTSDHHAVDTTGGFTVSAWVNPPAGTTGTRTAVSENGTNTSQFALQYDSGTGRWAFTLAGSDVTGPTFTRAVSGAAPAFGAWTHLVGVYDAGAKTIQLYVDGVAQGAVAYTTAWNASGVLLAGADRRNGATADWWSGDLDDVQVYARPMGATEVSQLFHNQAILPVKPTATTTVPAPVDPATSGCSPTGPYGVVAPTAANPAPALDVNVSDTDPTVTAGADFAIWDETAGQAVGGTGWSAGTQYGGSSSHEYRFTPTLTSGHRYAWYARTNDGSATSPPSDVCHFYYSVPFGLWPTSATPAHVDSGDGGSIEVGLRFRVNQPAVVSGIAFYKAATNTGTHTGSLWTTSGTLVATGTFVNETASGWQTLAFTSPVFIPANTTYIASYYAPNGHYSYDAGTFATAAVTNGDASGLQVTGLQYGTDGPNETYHYGGGGFPATDAGAGNNYWVQPLIRLGAENGPHVIGAQPTGTGVDPTYPGIAATFEAPIDPASVVFTLTSPSGAVPGTSTYDGSQVMFTPRGQLTPGVTYTASVKAGDPAGVTMASPYTWTFTVSPAAPDYSGCATYNPCGLWDVYSVTPGNPDFNDTSPNELGTSFTTAGAAQVVGIAFYKGSGNTGTHTGSLWKSDGTLLATGTFTGETDSGWQTLTFDTPVTIAPGTTYIASYYAPNGNYAADIGYFASAQANYPLSAPATGNGVFRSGAGGGFPNGTSPNQANYWVQPLIAAG